MVKLNPKIKKFLEMEKRIKREFDNAPMPYPVSGITKRKNVKIRLTIKDKSIDAAPNKDGEWLIDLVEFWWAYSIDWTKEKEFKISAIHKRKISIKKGCDEIDD